MAYSSLSLQVSREMSSSKLFTRGLEKRYKSSLCVVQEGTWCSWCRTALSSLGVTEPAGFGVIVTRGRKGLVSEASRLLQSHNLLQWQTIGTYSLKKTTKHLVRCFLTR